MKKVVDVDIYLFYLSIQSVLSISYLSNLYVIGVGMEGGFFHRIRACGGSKQLPLIMLNVKDPMADVHEEL